ncbi:MAG: hypothetical protein R2724_08500 [Bryobacterales bacterium]
MQELRRGYNSSSAGYNDRVIDDVELHGFNPQNSTIAVHNPPVTGAHRRQPVCRGDRRLPVPTTFMRIFGPDYSTVSARSVAGLERAGDPCIIVLNETEPDAFKTNGTISLQSNCGVMVNSNRPATRRATPAAGASR